MKSSVSRRSRQIDRKFGRAIQYAIEALEQRTLLNSYVVTNTNDSGSGSLRDAITQANENPGLDVIQFNIPGSGVHTIAPETQLPAITDPVFIDGTTQPGFSNRPLIELDGSSAGLANGLEFRVGDNTIQGLDIHSFAYDGIVFADIYGASEVGGNTVYENYIGTDPTGMIAEPNGQNGINLVHSPDNTIKENLLSGNAESGIYLGDADCTGNTIEGNYIGTDVSGLKALGNGINGVALGAPLGDTSQGYPSNNVIGGPDPEYRNIISGNVQSGIWIQGGSGNKVQGNYIGVGADGTTPVGDGTQGDDSTNQWGADGVFIDSASGNVIGGVDEGDANVISANKGDGVRIDGITLSADENKVQGNLIGTDGDGNAGSDLGNLNGVEIRNDSTSSAVTVDSNEIGGNDDDGDDDGNPAARNVLSGNRNNGINVAGNVSNTFIEGNYIGTDSLGLDAVPNQAVGILVGAMAGQTSGPNNIVIGSDQPLGGNLISGNAGDAIQVNSASAVGVFANIIGPDKSGKVVIGNGGTGVNIFSSSNVKIGATETVAGESGPVDTSFGNLISGNSVDGVEIADGSQTAYVVGNYIGSDITGNAVLGNGRNGITIADSTTTTIGGTTAASRNIIVGSTGDAVLISGSTATLNLVEGNYIGLSYDGKTALGNTGNGVEIAGAPNNVIGGTDPTERNFISHNNDGILLQGGANSAVVEDNYIGTDSSGSFNAAFGNFGSGVGILDSSDCQVVSNTVRGNGVSASGNITISASSPSGTATGNEIYSNIITNGELWGVEIAGQATGNVIGGAPSLQNIISKNPVGIEINTGANDNSIEYNGIGTDESGNYTDGFGNTQDGIQIFSANNEVANNTIVDNADGIALGGNNNTISGNVITHNQDDGIDLSGGTGNIINLQNLISENDFGLAIDLNASKNTVQGNFIGTDPPGAFDANYGNYDDGIFIDDANTNTIQGNKIRGNNSSGIAISGDEAYGNVIDGNAITNNTNGGVYLADNAYSNFVGQTTGNQISANSNGVEILGGAHDNSILLNDIGTDATGAFMAGLGNTVAGIQIEDASNNTARNNIIRGNNIGIFLTSGGTKNTIDQNQITNSTDTGVDLFGATQDTIGGVGNLISNNLDGIAIENEAQQNTISNNDIGTDSTGAFSTSTGNTDTGITVNEAATNTISNNTIRGNGTDGILITGSDSQGNQLAGNIITNNYGNGVDVTDSASNNTIGSEATASNQISLNTLAGVYIESGTGNAIEHNQIFDNSGLGIDLAPVGVNPNQPSGSTPTGPNNLQNYPVLTLATTGGSQRVAGSLQSAPNSLYLIEFFDLDEPDPSGYGQGDRYLISTAVTTNASGVASFNVTLPSGVAANTFISATATDSHGNTSEFSNTVRVETDTDGDGIPDDMEVSAPNGGDANDDGIPDADQANVASFVDPVTGQYVTLVLPSGLSFSDVTPVTNPSPDDAPDESFDLGFFNFTINGVAPGGAVAVQMILPQGTDPVGYERYGPTSDNPTPHWYDWTYNGQTGAEINGNLITLHFIDGGYGDDDLTANGTIVDPGAPAFPSRIMVTNTNDSGPGSLRQAILDANSHPGSDTIDFDIGSGAQTIDLLTPLPAITDSVTIDGTSQPGFSGTPLIEIDGQSLAGSGLTISASDSTILGLEIEGFTGAGITIDDAGQVTIQENTITGNGDGVLITGADAQGNQIYGNVITANNSNGIDITDDASSNAIGGDGNGEGNQISLNAAAGVYVESGTGNAILQNAISNNGGLGIDLAPLGGANDLQNSPVLILATGGGSHRVLGTLTTTADSTYVVEIFVLAAPDPSGYGEGDQYLLTTTVTTNDSGIAYFDVTLPAGVAGDGTSISATATDASGNTSEFSNAVQVQQDTDGDGISDAMEDAGPNGGDANHDGIPDSQESNVASFPDLLNGKYVTIEAPAGETLTDVNPLPYLFPEDGPTNASFSLGLFGFTLNGLAVGGSSEVNILLPAGSNPQSYFGYGAVPWDTEPEWYSWYDDGQTGADINGDEITLHVVDGQMGDNDQIANGSVSVVSGPGLPFHFVVTNTNDSGPGSLRQAIIDSNNQSGPQNYIDFDIEGGGVHTIYPQSPLPAITNWVIIDGTTQPGFAGTPIVVVNGSEAGTADGFDVGSPDVTIRGLVIDDFRSGGGIVVYNAGQYEPSPNDFDFAGNYIGTDVTGMVSAGNYYGIYTGAGDDGLIGGSDPGDGNVISGNISSGIYTISTSSLDIEGNYIGVGADGVTPIANGGDGVTIGLPGGGAQLVTDTTIGGMDPGDGNIIANNLGSGIDDYYDGDNDNAYLSNDIYANAIVGIANEPLGVAAINDIGGSSGLTDDTYGNPQNYPILGSAQSSGGQTTISGYLSSRPDESFIVQFFGNNGVPSNGEVEGAVYLGSTTVETDDNGYVSFTAALDVSVPDHELITATATSVVMNQTSAFSPRLGVGDVLGNVYIVNTTDDTDDGYINPAHMTLRDAILAANNHPGLDTIMFDINGGGLATIAPTEPLPVITDAVIIDGASQPGFDGTPLIQLSGAKMDPVPDQPNTIHLTGLYVLGDGSTIEGLDISGFYEFTQQTSNSTYWGGQALIVRGDDNTIEGDFIGTNPTGTKAVEDLDGVSVDGNDNLIGGTTAAARNIISGNYQIALAVNGSGNMIEDNFVGTDVTGTQVIGNGRGVAYNSVGISIEGANILGAPGAGNVISGNLATAVSLESAEGTLIQGNLIGTDVTGTKLLGNQGDGILVYDNDYFPPGTVPVGVTIGGTASGDGNVIAGNNNGINLNAGQDDIVQGNLIGTDITGTVAMPNNASGIRLLSSDELIGGDEPDAGNVISGNVGDGIWISTFNSSTYAQGTLIEDNYIGVGADGTTPLGNGADGILIYGSYPVPSDVVIGGVDAGDGNVIAFNSWNGVDNYSGEQIGILSNSIYSNGELGIDLGDNGVTLNDPGDTDSGPNNLQNYPVITSAVTDGSYTTVTGTLNSTPNTAFTLQFFSNAVADPSGYGEGQTLLGTRLVITDSTGNAEFTLTFPVGVTVGQFISATATDPLNDTSEFSADVVATSGTVAPNQPPSANAGGPYTINEGSGVTLDASLSADPDGDPLTYSWDINGDGIFGDATGVSPTLSWVQLEALGIVNGPSTFNVEVQVSDGQGHTVTSAATTLTVLNVPPTAIVGPDQYVTEGDTVTLVGSFTDPGNNDTHTFDWHVTSSNGQVIPDGTGETFTFVVDDNGTYTATFTVTDSDGGVGSATTYVYAANADPVVSIGGIPDNPAIGTQINLTSIVTDSPADTAAGFTYLWDIELEDNYSFFISAQTPDVSFTPQLPGIYDIYLSVTDKDYGSGYANASVTVPEQSGGTPVVTLGAGTTINEGDQYASTGSFTDPNAGESWTAIVDYGDGSGDQPLALNSDQTFDLAHVYTTPGTYQVNVTVTDSDGFSGSQTTQVAVNNVPPSITLPDPSAVSLGTPLTLAGSFTDPGDDTWTATVDYGDNTGTQPLTLASDNTFTLDHLYSSTGDFTITVVVSDNYGGSDTVTRTAVVLAQQQQPTSLVADPASAVYGGDTTLSATLSASGEPLAGQTIVFQINGTTVGSAATDNNGVATLPDLSIGSLNAGMATLSVSFAGDDSDAPATGASTLTVNKATLTVAANNASRVYGQDDPSFTGSVLGIENGDDITAVFSTEVSDSSPVGNYPITVALLDPDGRLDNYNVTTTDGTLTVLPTTLTAVGVNVSGSEGTPFSGVVATFTTNNPIAAASDFSATITWGDGHASLGTVMAASGGGFEVIGTNTYADSGVYAITVNIQDVPGQGSASPQAQASIANVPPTVFLPAPSPVSVGSTFTLSGSFSDPGADTWTGTVDYGDGKGAQPLSLAPDKSFSLSNVFDAAGTYTITVTITDKDGGVGTSSEPVIVNSASPVISTTPGGSVVIGSGGMLSDSATLSGGYDPSGTVTFYLFAPGVTPNAADSNAVYSDVVTVNGNATYSTTATGGVVLGNSTPAVLGEYEWIAVYGGDTNNGGAASSFGSEPETVTPATPTIGTSQQPTTATVGSSISDQATVTGGFNPTGTVTFALYNNSNGTGTALFTDAKEPLVNGVASSKGYKATATGTDYWLATYSGDDNNTSVSSPARSEPVSITPAAPAITTTQEPAKAVIGSSITDQATVSGGYSPTGTVTFSLYNNPDGIGTPLFTDANEPLVDGVTNSKGYIASATGTDYWVATYNGDSNNTPVASAPTAEPVTITPASPGIATTQQPASATVGSSIADQATLMGGYNPTGTVTFALYNNASASGTPLFLDANEPLVNGVATSEGYITTAVGTDYWVATYGGDSNNSGVSSPAASEPVSITPAAPTITTTQQPASAAVGSSIADKATVGGGYDPTGTVTFALYNNANASGTPLFTDANESLVNGVATSKGYTTTATGTDYWVATYNGDSNNAAVSSPASLEPVSITAASLTIVTTQQPASAVVGSSIADKATLSGGSNPTGTVAFSLYNNPNATGTPLFTDANEPLVSGVATSKGYTAIATGTDYWVATYNGDSDNSAVTSPAASEPVSITPATPAITTTPQPAKALVGSSIADEAQVSGGYNPTGTVTFSLYNNPNGTGTPLFLDASEPLVSGIATSQGYTVTAVGTDYWVATYNGNSNNSAISSPASSKPVTITAPSPTITTTPNYTSITLGTSTVTLKDSADLQQAVNPTGTIIWTLYQNGGSTAVYTVSVPVSGNGVYTTPGYTLPTTGNVTGTYQWDAAYSGDASNAADSDVNNAAERTVVSPANTTISTTPNLTSVTLGSSSVSLQDTATLSGGYYPTGTITFTLVSPNGTVLTTVNDTVSGKGSTYSATYSLPASAAAGTYQWNASYSGDSNNVKSSDVNDGKEQVVVKSGPKGSICGYVFCDDNLDGVFDSSCQDGTTVGETGEAGATITLTQGSTVIATTTSGTGGYYSFGNLPLGTYTVTITGYSLNHQAEISHGGITIRNSATVTLTTANPNASGPAEGKSGSLGTTAGLNFAEIAPGGLQGYVWDDANNDGNIDYNEAGIVNVTIQLNGVTYTGAKVSETAVTNDSGEYIFSDLMPGSYTLTEVTPNGFTDGKNNCGSLGSSECFSSFNGSSWSSGCNDGYSYGCGNSGNGNYCNGQYNCGWNSGGCGSQDDFCGIQIGGCEDVGSGYNFGNRGATLSGSKTNTASVAFWSNSYGQALLCSLNGGSNSTALGDWLATMFPQIYGNSNVNLAGMTNAQIAAFYNAKDFNVSGLKLNAAVFSAALSAYVTNSTWAGGNYAAKYGFTVTAQGVGYDLVNVGSNGAAFGVANNSNVSILQALAATDHAATNGVLYTSSATLQNEAYAFYAGIAQNGLTT